MRLVRAETFPRNSVAYSILLLGPGPQNTGNAEVGGASQYSRNGTRKICPAAPRPRLCGFCFVVSATALLGSEKSWKEDFA